MEKCKVAKNVTLDGKKYKIVDLEDACSSLNKVLARHEGSELITPAEFEKLKQ